MYECEFLERAKNDPDVEEVQKTFKKQYHDRLDMRKTYKGKKMNLEQ